MDKQQAPRRSIALLAAIVMASLVTLIGGSEVLAAMPYLVSVALEQRFIDMWTVLTAIVVISAVGGVVGAWLCIRSNKPFPAMALAFLPLIVGALVEANRCDVYPACKATDWARLPAAAFNWSLPRQEKPRMARTPPVEIEVLDGDTLLFNGKLVRIAGIDAPELGQSAKCWAEAALGGESRNALESALWARASNGFDQWELVEVSPPDAEGRIRANLVTKAGRDIRDEMVVDGHAAETDGAWDWCGRGADFHSPHVDQRAPHGPNIWRPAEHIYDRRAAD